MVADSVFAPVDSPYSHTSDALWTLWAVFDRTYSSAVMSGTYADKGGYHNKRDNLPSSDYSSGRDVRNDDYGPGNMASALDVKMSTADMKTATKRLKNAATSGDPRCKINGEWILREFIGTVDGTTVYCWVFTGGAPLGVNGDSGPDPGRDDSHLWHVHISVIRKFLNSMAALQQIASIVSGETVDQWRAREGNDVGMVEGFTPQGLEAFKTAHKDAIHAALLGNSGPTQAVAAQNTNSNVNLALQKLNAMAVTIDAIAQRVDIDPAELEAIKASAYEGAEAGAAAGVNPEAIAAAVLAGLQAAGLDPALYAEAVENAVREVFADAGTAG